jgi:hypothetical protein
MASVAEEPDLGTEEVMGGTKHPLRGTQARVHDAPIPYPAWQEFWSEFLGQKRTSFSREAFCRKIGVSESTFSKWTGGQQLPSGQHLSTLIDRGKLSEEQIEAIKLIYFSYVGLSSKTIDRLCHGLSVQHATCDQMLDTLDKEIFALARSESAMVEEAQVNQLIDDALADISDLFRRGHRQRVAIYLPDQADLSYATIKWHTGLPSSSLRMNRPYIGPDPVPQGSKRGVVGHAWHGGTGLFIPDVNDDHRYADFRQDGRRVPRPYISMLLSVIYSFDGKDKVGVLCVDSAKHRFTGSDLLLLDRIAQRIGRLLHFAPGLPHGR